MAYNSKTILFDSTQTINPIPQFYDPVADAFDPLTGAPLGNGRYGSDTISWGITTGGVFVPIQVDANGVQQMSLSGSNTASGDVVTIATANTAQQLPNVSAKTKITLIGLKGNTGTVYAGFANTITNTAHYFVALDPKETIDLEITNLDMVYIYGNAGDGVSYVAV